MLYPLRRCSLHPAVLAIALVALAVPVLATPPVNSDANGIAIGGYDTVAYFTEGTPAKGTGEHAVEWSGSTWWFKSAEHKELFASAPEKYAPRYGGFCALSVANGHDTPGKGEAWEIIDGKLYLNSHKGTHMRWKKHMARNITNADDWWPKIVDK